MHIRVRRYGDVVPSTDGGRAFTLLGGAAGALLTAVTIALTTDHLQVRQRAWRYEFANTRRMAICISRMGSCAHPSTRRARADMISRLESYACVECAASVSICIPVFAHVDMDIQMSRSEAKVVSFLKKNRNRKLVQVAAAVLSYNDHMRMRLGDALLYNDNMLMRMTTRE